MRDFLSKIDYKRILLVLFVAALSTGSGFLVGMWLGS